MRYVVRQKVFSLGDGFTIKDEAGIDIFMVKSQLLSLGHKLRIFDMAGNELCYIEQRLFRFMPEYDVYIGGQHVANVKKQFALFRNSFVITGTYDRYSAEGDFWAHEFDVYQGSRIVARISKQFFSFTDTYGVDVDDGFDQVTGLALAIVLDLVCHDNHDG